MSDKEKTKWLWIGVAIGVLFGLILGGIAVEGLLKDTPCRLIHLDNSLADVNPECYVTWWPIEGYGLEHSYDMDADGCNEAINRWVSNMFGNVADSGKAEEGPTIAPGYLTPCNEENHRLVTQNKETAEWFQCVAVDKNLPSRWVPWPDSDCGEPVAEAPWVEE